MKMKMKFKVNETVIMSWNGNIKKNHLLRSVTTDHFLYELFLQLQGTRALYNYNGRKYQRKNIEFIFITY